MSRPSRGQALVEALVGLLLLVPLLLALQALADLQAAAAQSTQSARLLALSTSLGGRPVAGAAQLENLPRHFTTLPAGSVWSSRMLRSAEPAAATAMTRRLRLAIAPAEHIAGGREPLEAQGWVAATAGIALPRAAIFGELLPAGMLTTQSTFTLLTEDAQASERSEVLARTQPLAVMRPLRTVLNSMRPVAALLSVMDPSFRSLCAVAPDPDLLPADRLIGGAAFAQPRGPCP